MNRVYPLRLAVCLCVLAILPGFVQAQCNCSNGQPATPVVTTFTLPSTSSSSAALTFDKLDPSLGDLSCMTMAYNLSARSVSGARNLAPSTALLPTTNPQYSPTGKTRYAFDLQTSANISGPGMSIVKTKHTDYGPDSLGAYGQPDDSITYGPDDVMAGVTGSASFGPNAAYLGSGTINLAYSISGGLNTVEGGMNYQQKIQTTYWGNFTLTYYWCPAAPLASSIEDFTATPQGHNILLEWLTNIQPNNSNYEIEVSSDGKNFSVLAEMAANPAATGPASKYQYQYNPDQTNVARLYFRIREISAGGRTGYSKVLIVTKDGNAVSPGFISYQVYPNPVVNGLVFRFNSAQTGRFLLELVNTAGQVVQSKNAILSAGSEIKMDLNHKPVKGLYFLRTRDLSHDHQYVSKVLVN